MADNTQKRQASSQSTGQEQSYAKRWPESSACSSGKKKRSKRNEYMLNEYIYETRSDRLPINETLVQKYA